MRAWLRRRRLAIRQWWDCRRHRCDYYSHYLAWGPADMPHETYHLVLDQALAHFKDCRYETKGFRGDGKLDLCPTCCSYERRIRA